MSMVKNPHFSYINFMKYRINNYIIYFILLTRVLESVKILLNLINILTHFYNKDYINYYLHQLYTYTI